MNKNQQFSSVPPKNYDKVKVYKTKNSKQLEEILPPRQRRKIFKTGKFMTDRSCFFSPEQKDFGQLFQNDRASERYQNQLTAEYGFDPVVPDTINQLKEFKNILCSNSKFENSSQCPNPGNKLVPDYVETLEDFQWLNNYDVNEMDKYFGLHKGMSRTQPKENIGSHLSQQSIHISDVPRVKIIAEKFSKLKKNNIELRKLDEKVVCVEYDVYTGEDTKPQQIMRAFFSTKPGKSKEDNNNKEIKTFNIEDEDLKDKEIEIINENITENRSYLDDLNTILRQNQTSLVKKNRAFDLMSLYEIANNRLLVDDLSSSNLFSAPELEEMKDLILKKCVSSIQDISRKLIKCEKGTDLLKERDGISQSLLAELMKEDLRN